MVDYLNCDFCQRNKLDGKGYGFLPELEVCLTPFEECSVDLIGPWTVQICGRPYISEALTVIDTVTNLGKLVRIERKTWTISHESSCNIGYRLVFILCGTVFYGTVPKIIFQVFNIST